MSVAWNLRLPYLYSSAVPGREWQRLIHHPWKRKDSWHVREKSAWFAYLLKEPPRGQPSPFIRPKNTGKLQHQHQNSQQYRVPLPIRAHKPQKSPTTASTRNFFLPNQPTSRHVVQQCIPDLRHALCLLQGEHIHQIYPSGSTRTVHVVVPPNSLKRHSRISSNPGLPLRYGMGCGIWDVPAAAAVALLLNPQEKEGRQQAKPAVK